MLQPHPAPEKVRFGPFELDRESGELLRDGNRIKLQDQPFHILCILLEQPGRIVTREELKNRMWPGDTFVEFDQGLYSAIRRLRDALSDTAEGPRYVETLARRGYRFIASVEQTAIPVQTPEPGKWRPSRRVLLLSAIALVLLVSLLVWAHFRRRVPLFSGESIPRVRSLAVLPLVNLSHDPEQDYFADGMTDELITDLAQLGQLRVISRTSAMHYKGSNKTLPQIAKELDVDAVVEGTVAREGNEVRIRVQLIRARDDRHLWAQAYDRDIRGALQIQSDAARNIAEQIRITLLPQPPAETVIPEAYEAYLRGRHELNAATSEADLERSISSFELAIAKDPQSGLGYAGLALSYVALSDYYRPPREVLPKAREAARKALELNEKLSEAHDALGWVEFIYGWNWSAAEKSFQRAIQLNPGNAIAHDHYANYFSSLRRHAEAAAESQRAQQIDPLSLAIRANAGFYAYMRRDYDHAIVQERSALELDPNCYTCRTYLALAYVQKGQFREGLNEVATVRLPDASPIDVATTGCVIASAGERGRAQALLRDLKQVARHRFVCPYEIATTFLALGDQEQALRELEAAYQARSICMIWLAVDPRLDTLRSDSRFEDLLRRVGLPH